MGLGCKEKIIAATRRGRWKFGSNQVGRNTVCVNLTVVAWRQMDGFRSRLKEQELLMLRLSILIEHTPFEYPER